MREIDEAVTQVADAADDWYQTDPAEKAALIARVTQSFSAVMDRWVELSVKAKSGGCAAPETLSAEEWLSGPICVLRNLRQLESSLRRIANSQNPAVPGEVRPLPSGGSAVEVLPADVLDRLTFPGFRGEVWLEPDSADTPLDQRQASTYREKGEGGVELVLGAGNVSSIAPTDVLYKLFVERRSVVLKTSPVLDYLNPLLLDAFHPLLERKALALVEGGVEAGGYLTLHERIHGIHVTGSVLTHQAIRELLSQRVRPARLSSELGNVSPVVVVPGPWNQDDFDFQAQSIVSMLVNNAGFNCNAARVLVLSHDWAGADRLLDSIRFHLATVPTRFAYYPGAAERHEKFVETHPEALQFGETDQSRLPWTLIPSVDPERPDDICFTTEPFCGVFAATRLPGAGTGDFLKNATRFCNEVLWGTLNATLLVDPETRADSSTQSEVDKAVADLRYGTVSINHWPGIAFGVMSTPWGGYPGSTVENPQSGLGVVHNTLMFDGVEKAVVESPFRSETLPPWFATAGDNSRLMARLARMLANA